MKHFRLILLALALSLFAIPEASADRVIKAGQFSGLELTLILTAIFESFGIIILFGVILVLFMKYPIRTFLRAKALGINPLPNRRMELVSLDEDKEMAKTKKGGYVFTNIDHFYIEPKSKKPIAIIDSRVGKTISLDAYRLMGLLKEHGYNSLTEMEEVLGKIEELTTQKNETDDPKIKEEIDKQLKGLEKDSKIVLTKGNYVLTADAIKDIESAEGTTITADGLEIPLKKEFIDDIKEHGSVTIPVVGETLKLADAVDFFYETMPGELIEAKIQYRTAVEQAKMKSRNLMQWVLVGGVAAMFLGFAVLLVSYAAPSVATAAQSLPDAGRVVGTSIG